jgi:hypothetical protein
LNCGFRTIVAVWGEFTSVSMYGPLAAAGVSVRPAASSAFGVFFGIGAANIRPRMLGNVPFGWSSWIVISPVLSSAVMPEMVSALPSAKSVAPVMSS